MAPNAGRVFGLEGERKREFTFVRAFHRLRDPFGRAGAIRSPKHIIRRELCWLSLKHIDPTMDPFTNEDWVSSCSKQIGAN